MSEGWPSSHVCFLFHFLFFSSFFSITAKNVSGGAVTWSWPLDFYSNRFQIVAKYDPVDITSEIDLRNPRLSPSPPLKWWDHYIIYWRPRISGCCCIASDCERADPRSFLTPPFLTRFLINVSRHNLLRSAD